MAFLYGLLRAAAAAMRLVASRLHARAKKRYENMERKFSLIEDDCKAYEVRVGSPARYNAQLRLLKAYETKERARTKWMRAANRLERRQRREQWLKELSGKKLPYSFGLVDMALVMHALDRLSGFTVFELATLFESVKLPF